MGLTLSSASLAERKIYRSTDIEYINFAHFKNKLLEFASKGKWRSVLHEKLYNQDFTFHYHNENGVVWDNPDEFENTKETERSCCRTYLKKLKRLKERYPDVYGIYPFIVHPDNHGEMTLEQVKRMLPVLERFYENDKTNYGNKAWNYNFTADLIDTFKDVVEKKGKLIFN